MKTAVLIPARFASTRLPGKPLLSESGKPLIQHTYEQAVKAQRADMVAVATDDARIAKAVSAFGGTAIMTDPAHETGSARIAEAAASLDADIIVNLQGDEPEIDPACIDQVIALAARGDSFAATLACPFPKTATMGPGSPDDPAAVKAILGKKVGDNAFRARYFTRWATPYPRSPSGKIAQPERYYLHIGIYAFSKDKLTAFAAQEKGALEASENLEQLRILEMGETIVVGLVTEAAPGIDTRADYENFLRRQGRFL